MARSAASLTDPTTDKPPRPRRWIPLSLQMFVVILSVTAAWTGIRACRQHAAIRAIDEMAGSVITDEVGPRWLRRWGGDLWAKSFDEIRGVNFYSPLITDEGLSNLKAFLNLIFVDFRDAQVTDVGLEQLSGLKKLETLRLPHTKVTDAGMLHLKGLPNLALLELRGTKITDAGLAHVNGIHSLRILLLQGTQVGDVGLEHLSTMTNLE